MDGNNPEVKIETLGTDYIIPPVLATPEEPASLDVPLHRRYRFWLPLLAALPALLLLLTIPRPAISGELIVEIVGLSNLLLYELRPFIGAFDESWTSLIVAAAAALLAFWYIVGRGLDKLRSGGASSSSKIPGWTWLLSLLALVELIRLLIVYSLIRQWYGVVFETGVYARYDLTLPLPVRVNLFLISYSVALFWGAAWFLVLLEIGRWIRRRHQAVSAAVGVSGDSSPSAGAQFSRGRALFYSMIRAVSLLLAAGWVALDYDYYRRVPDTFTRAIPTIAAVAVLAVSWWKWLFPEVQVGTILSRLKNQFRWLQFRRHLAFAGVTLGALGVFVVLATYHDHVADRLLSRFWRDLFHELLEPPLFGCVPLLLLWGLRIVYPRHWPILRRHVKFLVIASSILLACRLVDVSLSAAIDSATRAAEAQAHHPVFGSDAAPTIHALRAILRQLSPVLLLGWFAVFYRSWLFPGFRLRWPELTTLRRSLLSRRPRAYVLFATALWVLIVIAWQDRAVFWSILGYGSLIFLLGLVVPKGSRYRWILYGGVPACLLLILMGSYNPERDLFLSLAGFTIAYGYWRFAQRRGWNGQLVNATVLFLCIWTLCSLGDLLPSDLTYAASLSRRFMGSPQRFSQLRQLYPGKHVGVALSGGGYRAALMHAGVLTALEQLKIPVTNIAAVSGGSITAAHYALGGYPRELLYDVMFRQFNTARDFTDVQNAGRMLLSASIPGARARLLPGYSFSRTDVQAIAMDRVLLHGRRFKDLADPAPKLMICVTDLNSGNALGLTEDWRITRFLLRPPGQELFKNVRELSAGQPVPRQVSTFALLDSRETALSKAVAASSAFPLAFAPVPLAARKSGYFLMADGGVTDNTGMTLLLEADRRASLPPDENGNPQGDKDWALDVAVSVDGGAMYQRNSADPELGGLEAVGRAVDIIYARIGPEAVDDPGSVPARGPATVLLSPYLYMDNSRNYDYSRIRTSFDGLADDPRRTGPDQYADLRMYRARKATPLLFSPEQQQLFRIVATQIAGMDKESLQLLLFQEWKTNSSERDPRWLGGFLESVNPGYYGDLASRLEANWLSDGELRLLEQSASGHIVDKNALDLINRKRRARTQIMETLAFRVAEDLSFCLATFVKTPTLEDNISEQDARRLFRLGQYLALLNAAQIRQPLSKNSRGSAIDGITAAEKANVTCAIQAFTKSGELNSESIPPVPNDFREPSRQNFTTCLREKGAGNAIW